MTESSVCNNTWIHYKQVVYRLSGTCAGLKKTKFCFVSDVIMSFFHLTYRQIDKGQISLAEFHSCSMVFREVPHLPSPFCPNQFSKRERTGHKGQAEVDHRLAAMLQTAEVRRWMLQLLLWHPEKWETQDVGAKPSVTESSFNQHKSFG